MLFLGYRNRPMRSRRPRIVPTLPTAWARCGAHEKMSMKTLVRFGAWLPLALGSVLGAAPLPWEREIPLREAARTASIAYPLDPQQPTTGANVGRNTLSNLQVRSALWG